jgi:hypothetical protein
MGQSDPTVNIDIQDMVMKLDISAVLPRIEAPVLVGPLSAALLPLWKWSENGSS